MACGKIGQMSRRPDVKPDVRSQIGNLDFPTSLPHQVLAYFVDDKGDLFGNNGLAIEYPGTVKLGKNDLQVGLRISNLPPLPQKKNRVLPLTGVRINHQENADQQDDVVLPYKYSPKTGSLDISLPQIHQLAAAVITGTGATLMTNRRERARNRSYLRWAHGVLSEHPELQEDNNLGEENTEDRAIRLTEWLTTNALLLHAVLPTLPIPQAVYRRYVQGADVPRLLEPVAVTLIEGLTSIHGVGVGLGLGNEVARAAIDTSLDNTISAKTNELYRQMRAQGPLIKFIK